MLANAAGQRVFKSEPQTAQTLPSETTLGTGFVDWLKKNFGWLFAQAQINATLGTAYIHGDADTPIPGWALLGEYGNGGASSTGRTEYIWLPMQDGNAIPVAMYRNGRYWNIHTDHLGTPRMVTDDTGKPVWQWAYSAFGDNKPTGILKATANPNTAITNQPVLLNATNPAQTLNLRFPGQYFDAETNLAYNWNRYYVPGQGRYGQSDPIGLAGGLNRFAYVEGNPVSRTDPTGLVWVYQQSTGNLYHQPGSNPANMTLVSAGGYAGHGVGVNNSALESIRNVGPLPQGGYTIGPQQTIITRNVDGSQRSVLSGAMRLTPDRDNWMYGRDAFIIHGGNMQTRTSSNGCIVQTPDIRNLIGGSADRRLQVVP